MRYWFSTNGLVRAETHSNEKMELLLTHQYGKKSDDMHVDDDEEEI